MDITHLKSLLFRGESETLDYKVDNYSFDTDEEKSELLKDILAFANAWRDTDAYILIGFTEPQNGRARSSGITKGADDNAFQNLVKSKVQKPVRFSYEQFQFEGVQCAAIRIPVQERPFHTTKDYGKCKANTVYIRRGSSTGEATPDEVAQMGKAKRVSVFPKFEVMTRIQERAEITPALFLNAWLKNIGDVTAYEVMIDFEHDSFGFSFDHSTWQDSHSATAKRSLAATMPIHPEKTIWIGSWKIFADCEIVSPLLPPPRCYTLKPYEGPDVVIELAISSKDHSPVRFKVEYPATHVKNNVGMRSPPLA